MKVLLSLSRTTLLLLLLAGASLAQDGKARSGDGHAKASTLHLPNGDEGSAACTDSLALQYPCHGIDLVSRISLPSFNSTRGNDIWGWTDPESGIEYALVGLDDGTAFVDISDPAQPQIMAKLPAHADVRSTWRDIKVFRDHAYVVSEADTAGLQVYDLRQLRTFADSTLPVTVSETFYYDEIGNSHNIAINEASGYGYIVGSRTCDAGLHMIALTDPSRPTFAGCFEDDGYTHDVQCVIYAGPDVEHQGKEICFASNEDSLTIVDVTRKSSPEVIFIKSYPDVGYTHQGWLDDEHRYFYQNDELDELNAEETTGIGRSLIWDLTDLDDPLVEPFSRPTDAIDHNLYTAGDLMYQANYTGGLRIFDISDRTRPEQLGFFDTTPDTSLGGFRGLWSVYPYFESGNIVVNDIGSGLYILSFTEADRVANEPDHPDPFETNLFPNPSSGDLQLTYTADSGQATRIRILDVTGREINSSVRESTGGTLQRFTWNGQDQSGQPVAQGTYFIVLESGDTRFSRAFTIVR